ncbi:hypothetical protein [Sandaracinus amylolyticus]|uniref:hypothetical protein n=1 Tax=Sandaracinus amylolyticus TaxID=927083 RepID=UPI001F2C63EA|nr:hypothetical protein [Sandaracinus amylolyticus]
MKWRAERGPSSELDIDHLLRAKRGFVSARDALQGDARDDDTADALAASTRPARNRVSALRHAARLAALDAASRAVRTTRAFRLTTAGDFARRDHGRIGVAQRARVALVDRRTTACARRRH